MFQFSLKRLMAAVGCFGVSCAFWKLIATTGRDWPSWADQVLFGCYVLGFAGFGMSAGILCRRRWVGLVAAVVASFVLPWISIQRG